MTFVRSKVAGLTLLSALVVTSAGLTFVAVERQADAAPPMSATVADVIASMPEGTSVEQRAALADGEVTYHEHEEAIGRTIACMSDAGWDVRSIPGNGVAPTSIDASLSEPEIAPFHEDYMACSALHLDVVDTAWAVQQAGDPGARAEARAILRDCLTIAGLSGLPDPLMADDVLDLIKTVSPDKLRCVEEARLATGVQP